MKYKAKYNLLKELNKFPHFNKELILQLGTDKITYNLTKKTIDTYISRFLKNREIITLKGGLYIPTEFYEKNKNNTTYLFYLANILRKPSYISSWTALQYHGLTTEIIHTISSVTTNLTRNYTNTVGTFSYHTIQKELFSNFSLVKPAHPAGRDKDDTNFDFFIATPAKALFDLLYFKTRQFNGLSLENIRYIIDELRIDIDEMEETEQNNFYTMLKTYL